MDNVFSELGIQHYHAVMATADKNMESNFRKVGNSGRLWATCDVGVCRMSLPGVADAGPAGWMPAGFGDGHVRLLRRAHERRGAPGGRVVFRGGRGRARGRLRCHRQGVRRGVRARIQDPRGRLWGDQGQEAGPAWRGAGGAAGRREHGAQRPPGQHDAGAWGTPQRRVRPRAGTDGVLAGSLRSNTASSASSPRTWTPS